MSKIMHERALAELARYEVRGTGIYLREYGTRVATFAPGSASNDLVRALAVVLDEARSMEDKRS